MDWSVDWDVDRNVEWNVDWNVDSNVDSNVDWGVDWFAAWNVDWKVGWDVNWDVNWDADWGVDWNVDCVEMYGRHAIIRLVLQGSKNMWSDGSDIYLITRVYARFFFFKLRVCLLLPALVMLHAPGGP